MTQSIKDEMQIESANLSERRGRIQANINIIQTCLQNIKEETEFDIWFSAWSDTGKGVNQMQRLLNDGYVR